MSRLRKLSKWLLVFIVVLVADLYLAQGYQKTAGEIARLEPQLSTANQAASKLALLQKDVQSQQADLAAARAQLATNESLFPTAADALEIVNLVVASAQAGSVQLLRVQELPSPTEKLVNYTYGTDKYRIVAQGQLSALSLFLSQIESQAKPTWRIDSIVLVPTTGNEWKMNFNIIILTGLKQGS